MHRVVAIAFVGLFIAGTAAAADPDVPACIRYWGEARNYGYGYSHLVHIVSSCDVDYDCSITTDVNPEPTKATVPAKQEVVVSTYLSSPSSVFTPHAKCTKSKK